MGHASFTLVLSAMPKVPFVEVISCHLKIGTFKPNVVFSAVVLR